MDITFIEETVKEYLLSNYLFGYSEDEIDEQSSFSELGVLDSTGIMEIVEFIEMKFGIVFEDEEIIPTNLDSLSQIALFVKAKKDAKA